jgi:sec-independent protein translocase protein TatA
MITGWEWIVMALVIVAILLWGPKKLPELARAVGQARKEFEKAQKESEVFTKPGGLLSEASGTTAASGEDTLLKTAKELGISTEGKTKDQISQEIIQKAKEQKK